MNTERMLKVAIGAAAFVAAALLVKRTLCPRRGEGRGEGPVERKKRRAVHANLRAANEDVEVPWGVEV
jgi:hypothetical protein